MNGLFWRAAAAFLAMPGMVAFLVPLLLAQEDGHLRPFGPAGVLLLSVGCLLIGWCVREFYVAGRGTLAPWAPPKFLVTSGPYRYSRNPMYVAVLLILCGWALGFGQRAHWLYAASMGLAFHSRVVWGEEPWLTRTHGDRWLTYRQRVRRWL